MTSPFPTLPIKSLAICSLIALLLALVVANPLGRVTDFSTTGSSAASSPNLVPGGTELVTLTAATSFTIYAEGQIATLHGNDVTVDAAALNSFLSAITASSEKLWENMIRHALRGHASEIVRCVDHFHRNLAWPEVWVSDKEVSWERGMYPQLAVVADVDWIKRVLLNSAAGLGPCAGLTQEVVNREFSDGSKRTYDIKKVRAVIVFARNSYLKRGNPVEELYPRSLFLVYDFESWRCYNGFKWMLRPVSGFRPC